MRSSWLITLTHKTVVLELQLRILYIPMDHICIHHMTSIVYRSIK